MKGGLKSGYKEPFLQWKTQDPDFLIQMSLIIFYILKMDPEKGEESPEHRVDRAGSTELSTVHVRGPKCLFDMEIHY